MDTRNSLRSQALDLLRFPLACIIVVNHVFGIWLYNYRGLTVDFTQYHGYDVFIAFLRSFTVGQSVPIYYFIAGYVFFLGINLDMSTYWRKMKNRFHSLFVPYVMWTLLALAFFLLPYLPVLHGFFPSCDPARLKLSLGGILDCFWIYQNDSLVLPVINVSEVNSIALQGENSCPLDPPLWFVRDLIIVAVATPLINLLFKRYGSLLPLLSGVIWIVLPNVLKGHAYQILTALFFFSLGGYLSFRRHDMVEICGRFRTASYVIYPLIALYLFAYSLFSGNLLEVCLNSFGSEMVFVKNMAIIAGLPFAYNLAVDLIRRFHIRPSRALANASFFIYAAHMIFMGRLNIIIGMVIRPVSQLNIFCLLAIETVVLCVGLLVLYLALKRYTPRFLGLFTGGR